MTSFFHSAQLCSSCNLFNIWRIHSFLFLYLSVCKYQCLLSWGNLLALWKETNVWLKWGPGHVGRWAKWSHSVLFPYSGNGVLIPSVPPVCWALYKNHTRDIPESKVWVPFGKCGNWGSKMTVRKSQTQTLKFIFNETRCIVSATSARQKIKISRLQPPSLTKGERVNF